MSQNKKYRPEIDILPDGATANDMRGTAVLPVSSITQKMNFSYTFVYVTCHLSKWQIPVFPSAGTCFLYSYFPGG